MRTRTVVGVVVAALVVGAVVMVSNDHVRAGRTDTAEPPPSAAGSSRNTAPQTPTATTRGPLDPAARRYLDAVAASASASLAAAFAPDGLVVDVGREIRGRDAIRQWASNEVIGGVYTLLGHTPRQDGVTLLVRFQPGGTGGFRANYHFDIANELITKATLEYA
jgi:hypothetical protein